MSTVAIGSIKQKAIERIINAAMSLLVKEGVGAITVRKIAHLAQVNVAAVNYYFRSKNNVINQALKCLTDQMTELFSVLDHPGLAPKEKLAEFLLKFTEVVGENPMVFGGIVQQMFARHSLPGDFLKNFRSGFQRLTELLRQATGINNEETLMMMMCQALSGILAPALAGENAQQITGLRLDIPRVKRKYVRLLVDRLLSVG